MSRRDGCKDWADKAEAMASYARQADDPKLEKMSMKIRARAIERCGELLKEYDGRGGDRSKNGGTSVSASSRTEAGAKAGMSTDQVTQAVRVANVPKDEFEKHVESDDPPSIAALS